MTDATDAAEVGGAGGPDIRFAPGTSTAVVAADVAVLVAAPPTHPASAAVLAAIDAGGGYDEVATALRGGEAGPLAILPSVAVLGWAEGDRRVLVRGDVVATLAGPDGGPLHLTGAGADPWSEERVAGLGPVRLAEGAAAAANVDPGATGYRLAAGIVPASALAVYLAPTAPATPAEPAAPPLVVDDEPGTNVLDVGGPQPFDQDAPAAPPPGRPAVRCAAGHLNPAGRDRCRACDQPIGPQEPVWLQTPLLGVLRFSTGEAVPVLRSLVIGRAPKAERDGDADGDGPDLVTVPSPQHDISRTHLEVRVDGWDLWLVDRGSTNGTVLTVPGAEPVRLPPGQPVALPFGALVSLAGEVDVVFEPTR